jgi:hypothetical protein
LPSWQPFLRGKLADFLAVNAFCKADHFHYVIVTRRIADRVLTSEIAEVCDVSSQERKLLLSGIVPSSKIGCSHIACLFELS